MHQHVCERTSIVAWWKSPIAMVCVATQIGGNLVGWQSRTTVRQHIHNAIGLHAADAQPNEFRTVRHVASKVRSHSLDIPALAKARSRELRIVQAVDQIGDLTPLSCCGGIDVVAVHCPRVRRPEAEWNTSKEVQ